ncbi:hypothetical protein HQ496_11660 [bacterium]|nr:hypothetical protein [bacterium]
MFISLLIVTFALALLVSWILTRMFRSPVQRILDRIIADEISSAWTRYLTFAIYVVGVSGGVRVWDFEKYITPLENGEMMAQLTPDYWTLEIYRAIVGTLQSVAWMLLVFFLVTLIAYVIVKGREIKPRASS